MNFQALTGCLSLFNELPGLPLADLFGAAEGAFALTAAMDAVARGEPGRRVGVSLSETLKEVQSSAIAVYRATGEVPLPGETLFSGKFPCYRLYTAGCGRRVTVGAIEAKFWEQTCKILGTPELIPRGLRRREKAGARSRAFKKRWEPSPGPIGRLSSKRPSAASNPSWITARSTDRGSRWRTIRRTSTLNRPRRKTTPPVPSSRSRRSTPSSVFSNPATRSWISARHRAPGPSMLPKKWAGRGRILGVDLQPIKITLPNALFIAADMRDLDLDQTMTDAGIAPPFDVVLSDLAPKTIGIRLTDQMRSLELSELALETAERFLKPRGHFVAKLFHSEEFEGFRGKLRARFGKVEILRPQSTRKESKEIFFIALQYKPPKAPKA